nr:hypothetical protein Iba_scaffold45775CG0010 [Ipomoea batatas]GMD95052.1 hypothetical protein Iba_chr15aCG8550 [Ipomoea batatas]
MHKNHLSFRHGLTMHQGIAYNGFQIQHCFSKSTWQQSHSLQADELPLYTASKSYRCSCI